MLGLLSLFAVVVVALLLRAMDQRSEVHAAEVEACKRRVQAALAERRYGDSKEGT